jgi:hypothetical protein
LNSQQNIFTPNGNPSTLVINPPSQGNPLTVINELDDKKGKKKKKGKK